MSGIEVGQCKTCGQQLLHDPSDGDVWHPWDVPEPCPAARGLLIDGKRAGRPGVDNFVRT